MRVNAYESEYRKFDESVNIHKFGKISSSVNVVQTKTPRGNFFFGATYRYLDVEFAIRPDPVLVQNNTTKECVKSISV